MPDFARTSTKATGFSRSPFSSFKQQQRFANLARILKKILIGFAFLTCSLFLSVAIISFIFLRLANWQRKGTTSVAFLTSEKSQVLKQTTVLWVDPEKNEISILDLPGDLSVHTPGSVAYSLKALYGLYAINHALPADFQKALARNIRIDVPFFMVREGKTSPSEMGLRRYVLGILLDNKNPSLFPLADRFALLWYVWFSGASVKRLELPPSIVASPQGLDELSYDTFLQKNFLNVNLKKEALSIAVVNASSQSRLASTLGRMFTAFGLNILSVSDTPNVQDLGSIQVNSGQLMSSETVGVLGRYITGPVQVNPTTTSEYRADIVVFLGKKEAENFIP